MAGNKCCQSVAENTLFPSTNSRPDNSREQPILFMNNYNQNIYNSLLQNINSNSDNYSYKKWTNKNLRQSVKPGKNFS